MYFPFVFGKQYDLLALKVVSKKYGATSKLVPIISPVKKEPSQVVACLSAMGGFGTPAVLVTNPNHGDFQVGTPSVDWIAATDSQLSAHAQLIPGLCCHSRVSFPEAIAFINKYAVQGKQVALLYANPGFSSVELSTLGAEGRVRFHIVLNNGLNPSQASTLPMAKMVYVQDCFTKKDRNADYSGADAFSSAYLTFSSVGVGFGDYTVIGAEYKDGGGPPGAVAIHATYKHLTKNQLYVEHFISDDVVVGVGDVAKKYLQAVGKLVPAAKSRSTEFVWSSALGGYDSDLAKNHFPQLGKNKERQIVHHIETVMSLI